MTADAPASVLPFPLPHSPGLDRPHPVRGKPHEPATVAAVRLYFERTTLTYAEIARETGVSPASVSRYAFAGGWQRPPGAWRNNAFTNGLPGPPLRGRMLARRLRDICERYLDEMEQKPDLKDLYDCGTVLAMLQMAKETERRRPRPPLAARARVIAERYLDELESDPQRDLEQLAWVVKMLETARAEEALARTRPAPKPAREPRLASARRTETEPSPHPPEAFKLRP
jgi:hypothetical protein